MKRMPIILACDVGGTKPKLGVVCSGRLIELRERAIRVWSAALVNLIHAHDPECAVIGGGIMRSGNSILPKLRQHVARHAWTPWGKVKIRTDALGNDAGMIGVASLFAEAA